MIEDATIWTVIAAMAVGSFAIRFSVLGLAGRRPMPAWLIRHLRYAAVAIIPGLVAPLVLSGPEGAEPARLVAAVVTVAVGIWRRDVLSAMAAGAATFAAVGLLAAAI